MQQQYNSTPSSSTSIVTRRYDSCLALHRAVPATASPPSPVPRRLLNQCGGHAQQTTRNLQIADSASKFICYFPSSTEEVFKFATRQNTTFDYVKRAAKQLGLRITRGNRGGRLQRGNLPDRIAFGLKTGVIKLLKEKNVDVKLSLFNFGMRLKTGFLQPSR